MEKLEQQVNQLFKEDGRHERRLNDHSKRSDTLEQFKSSTEIEIRNLIEQIKSLVSTIKWFMTFGTATLVGFFIWYTTDGKALGSGTGQLKYAMVVENVYRVLPTVLTILISKRRKLVFLFYSNTYASPPYINIRKEIFPILNKER